MVKIEKFLVSVTSEHPWKAISKMFKTEISGPFLVQKLKWWRGRIPTGPPSGYTHLWVGNVPFSKDVESLMWNIELLHYLISYIYPFQLSRKKRTCIKIICKLAILVFIIFLLKCFLTTQKVSNCTVFYFCGLAYLCK